MSRRPSQPTDEQAAALRQAAAEHMTPLQAVHFTGLPASRVRLFSERLGLVLADGRARKEPTDVELAAVKQAFEDRLTIYETSNRCDMPESRVRTIAKQLGLKLARAKRSDYLRAAEALRAAATRGLTLIESAIQLDMSEQRVRKLAREWGLSFTNGHTRKQYNHHEWAKNGTRPQQYRPPIHTPTAAEREMAGLKAHYRW